MRSKQNKSPSARTRWERLAFLQQFALARRIINRRGPEWRRRFHGLRSVGFGVRHTRKERQEGEAPAILFFVERKGTIGRGGKLPKEIRATVLLGAKTPGKVCQVSIPTDVVESRHGELQAPFEARDAAGAMLKLGNACCALATGRNQPATFLLGCHHVFLDSEDDPGLKPGPVSFISFNGNRIGGVALAGQMNPGSPPAEDSDDAALATIQPAAAATLASYWRLWQPGDLARNFLPIALDGNYALYADGAFLPAKFIGWAPGFLVPVGNGQTIRIPEALLYDANSAPGVSGAAFLDRDNNIILGMHMARMQSKDTPVPWVAVAQPLWRLLAADGPFAQDLYLGRLPNPT